MSTVWNINSYTYVYKIIKRHLTANNTTIIKIILNVGDSTIVRPLTALARRPEGGLEVRLE
jgi:hypothetical protein